MTKVFISYRRKDTKTVKILVDTLKKKGLDIWWDQESIKPGTIWKNEIRKGIEGGAYFIACFSKSYNDSNSEMNEELFLAIERLRRFPQNTSFLIPVKLDNCSIPHFDLFASKTLSDIQFVDLYKDWDEGINNLLSVLIKGYKKELGISSKPKVVTVLFRRNSDHHRYSHEDFEIYINDINKGILEYDSETPIHVMQGKNKVQIKYDRGWDDWDGETRTAYDAKSQVRYMDFQTELTIINCGYEKFNRKWNLFNFDWIETTYGHTLYMKAE